MRTITWLHISDLHTNDPKYGWDYDKVTCKLIDRLKMDRDEYSLMPDFIFFTGDIAYGQIGDKDGETLDSQYAYAKNFLEEVRTTFGTGIHKEDIFIVPGNHDINIQKHDSSLVAWLKSNPLKNVIHDKICKADDVWPKFMNKLTEYEKFLRDNGYNHLIEGNKDGIRHANRGIYSIIRERHKIKIAITGLNSAWSSAGEGQGECGKLRLGGEAQVGFFYNIIKKSDFCIALMHHPINWFASDENDSFEDTLVSRFNFFLHGHEHANKVHPIDQYNRIGAGACYERGEKETGYNFVRLNLDDKSGEVWFRHYSTDTGGGWIPHVFPNNTTNVHGMRKLKTSLEWMANLHLEPKKEDHAIHGANDVSDIIIESNTTLKEISQESEQMSKSSERIISEDISLDKPLQLVAIPPDILADYLCDLGPQLIVGNKYVQPEFKFIGGEPGALSRIYVGPADCGKTRAALEWIIQKVDVSTNAWTILRAEEGTISRDAAKFIVDRESYYRSPRPLPKKAILFIDDIPEYLSQIDRGIASQAVKRLFDWFATYPGFEERCLVGTVRTERMGDKPDWPQNLSNLGQRLELLSVQPLNEIQRRDLWKGMEKGRISRGKEIENYQIEIDDYFLEALTDEAAPPESIAYFVRSAAERNTTKLTTDDVSEFSHDVAGIWLKRTWPALTQSYGLSARVFHTLARFLEAGTRHDSDFLGNLQPAWEYHAILGPALLMYHGGNGDEYISIVRKMLSDGNAVGRENEWIRPKWDFLLQASDLEGVDLSLPSWEWFTNIAESLAPEKRASLAAHLSAAGVSNPAIKIDAYWIMGWAEGKLHHSKLDPSEREPDLLEAISNYDDLIARFGGAEELALKEQVAKALINKGVTLGEMKKSEEEIAVYDDLIARFGGAEELALKEQVVKAILYKGVTLGEMKKSEEEIAVYDDLIARFGGAEELALKERVANAFLYKGVTLGEMKKSEEEIAVYDDLIARLGGAEELALKERVAKALINKGISLGKMKKSEEAIAVYDDLIGRFGGAEELALKEPVAKALINKGVRLRELSKSEEAIAVYDDLIGRFGGAEELALKERVAKALINKGISLGEMKKSEEAIAVYDDLIGRFGGAEELALKEPVAKALINKGFRLGELRKSEESIAVYDDLIARFGGAEELALKEPVARALINKGVRLRELSKSEEAIAVYDDLIARFGGAEELALNERVAKTFLYKGVTLGEMKKSEEEIAVYDDLIARFGGAEELALKELVAKALINKGFRLGELRKSEEAIAVYDDLIARFGGAEELALKERVAKALINKCISLGKMKKSEEAIAVYDDLIARFGGVEELALKELVGQGESYYADLLVQKYHDSGDKDFLCKALDHSRRAVVLGGSSYNLSCVLALSGKLDEAFKELECCLESKKISWSHIDGDSGRGIEPDGDWDGLREHPRYLALKEKYG